MATVKEEEKKLDTWLPLNEYASKHQISVSTLRRRIKSNKIQFELDEGKYFLLEDGQPTPERENLTTSSGKSYSIMSSEPITTTRLLLDELKRAYLDSLQSKEDQILYLKQQVSDLKTLVMLLEKENNRINTGDSQR